MLLASNHGMEKHEVERLNDRGAKMRRSHENVSRLHFLELDVASCLDENNLTLRRVRFQ